MTGTLPACMPGDESAHDMMNMWEKAESEWTCCYQRLRGQHEAVKQMSQGDLDGREGMGRRECGMKFHSVGLEMEESMCTRLWESGNTMTFTAGKGREARPWRRVSLLVCMLSVLEYFRARPGGLWSGGVMSWQGPIRTIPL